jgi:T5SS/PEP-CTERM-associated repeat protein
MRLGVVGSANLLIVSNGGFLDTRGVSIGSTGVSNLAIVTGTNSVWTNGTATIGDNSDGNGVIVSNGGTAFGFAVLGNSTNASSNFLLVTGSNSVFNGGVDVGFQGAGNRLVVSNGGTVRSSSATVGVLATASNNLAIVTGAGSLWSNASSVDIGESGSGSVLLVSNGGVFAVNGNVLLGATTSSINNRIVVDGGTLRATNPAGTASLNLRRGTNQFNAGVIDVNQLVMTNSNGSFEFNGGTLITRGAFISNGVLFAVGAAGATPAVWDVRAGASPNVLAGQLRIGSNTSFNQLLITNGALLTSSSFGVIGLSNGANSNLVLVSGTGSRWLMGNNLLVGDGGAFNRLVVSNGALVGNVDGQVGFTTTSSNNEALVTGAGSLWSNQSGLFVGFAGGGSRVVVSNGGTVFASNGVFVGLTTNSTNNRLIVDGGTLRAANPAGGGVLDVRRGTNVLNAGLIDVNGLLVTNVLGIFEFNGGTLVTGNTTNNNGRIFTVGNGTSAATLQLNGGTHAFSNNLVIASNASLIGAGTIVGNVTNFGGFSAGTSPGSLGINGSLFLQPSARMTFEIGGLFPTNQYDVIAVTNFVEFAGTLSLSFINNFLPAPTNSFTLVSFASSSGSFTNAPNGGRVNLTNNLASFSANYTGTTFVLGNVQYVDSDGDGQGDLQEQAAGTNPNESSVYLEVTSITQNASNHIVIQFQSVSGKNYRIEHTTNFNSGFTGLIASPSLTAPATNISQWIDDGSLTGGLPVGQRYYRIGLQP